VVSANWDGVVFETSEGLVRVPSEEPLRGTRRLVGRLLDEATSVERLLDLLGSGATVPVEEDPGW
jgi:proteasome accessory factor A